MHQHRFHHFESSDWDRPTLDGLDFTQVTVDQNVELSKPFTGEEIEEMVKSSDGSKSPGPDGFNFAFFKSFWDLMKFEVRIMFDQFHGNACLPKSLFSYFITLIPKVKSPQSLSEFRPISLLGCLYKLVSKVLAARLAKVIGSLILKTQSAFIKGRSLVEGVVAVNEIIDFAKKSRESCLIFKVDFEKAYDSVDWGFLDYILRRFGIGDKWRAWMWACVCSGSMSVSVNGSPTEEINIMRGLKQGDPLAPHLFLLVAEGLGALMRKAVEIERFKPFRIGREGLPVSLLQYADDTLCIGEATVENLWTLKAVLRGFELASGLKVNFWKSSIIGVNVPNDFMAMAATFLNCRIGKTPFKYLGLPVGANPRLMSTWKPMLDVIRGRVGSWGNKYLSFGGRIVMVNAILNAIPIFYLSYLKMPVNVWKEVVKIQRKFLWSGLSNRRKISWVKWEDVCKPKSAGGLGVRDLRLTNISLLAKWRWKLLQPDEELWKDIVVAKYGNGVVGRNNLGEDQISRFGLAWWRNICLLDNNLRWFELGVSKVLGNGNATSFWNDVWVRNQSLAVVFPRLYSISLQHQMKLSQMGSVEEDGWRWILT
ncbi:LINE-1 reverse transcriptase like [Trifolium medium]|uniref:LINE-1 reverse transcriptase like n=1 Tax=Trifolium medium TaxID=97028 RepID=A0A392M0X5_9FABA|nr:LINE-1 reverse transcriptase like [Trifolium medium]